MTAIPASEERAAAREPPDRDEQRRPSRRGAAPRRASAPAAPRARRDGLQARAAVVLLVLQRVDDVESGRPEEDREAEQDRQQLARDPRTAIQAPTGASARQRPSTKCDSAREPLRVGVEEEQRERDRREEEASAGSGSPPRRRRARPRRRERPARSRPRARPTGSAREAVRGFAASIRRSASRLCAIAALRAPTIASRILPSVGRCRPAAGREERREQREGQREERVRELDHLERRPERTARRPRRALTGRALGAAPETARRAGVAAPTGTARPADSRPSHARRAHAVGVEEPVDRRRVDVEGRQRRRDDRAGQRRAAHVLDVDERVGRLAEGEHERAPLLQAHVGGALEQVARRCRWRSRRACRRCRGRRSCPPTGRSRRRSSAPTSALAWIASRALRARPASRRATQASGRRRSRRRSRCGRPSGPRPRARGGGARGPGDASAISTKRRASSAPEPPETPTTISRSATRRSLYGPADKKLDTRQDALTPRVEASRVSDLGVVPRGR